MWTDDSLDWERKGVSSIVSRVMAAARPGAVILFHDAGERSQTSQHYASCSNGCAPTATPSAPLCRD
jgi:peptidoglycan/xylan/chitin deacetylase (PgdA/CDA1 family)